MSFAFPLGIWSTVSGGGGATPLLWWKLNDASGTTITATNGVNGTTNGTWTASTQNGAGTALVLNGTSQYAVTNSTTAWGANILTIEFWINATSWTSGSAQELLNIGAFDFGNPQSSNVIRIWAQANELWASISGSSGQYRKEWYFPDTFATHGNWHHFAFVFDSTTDTGAITFYLDGTAKANNDVTSSRSAGSAGNIVTANMNLGRINDIDLGGIDFFPGTFDDVQIWSGDRGATQIAADFAANAH